MAQLVRGDVEQHLANVGPATWFQRAEIDFYLQTNKAALISVEVGSLIS